MHLCSFLAVKDIPYMLALLYCCLPFSETVSQRGSFPFLIKIYSPLPIPIQACFCKCCCLSDISIFPFPLPMHIACTSHQSLKWRPLGSIISLLRPGRRWLSALGLAVLFFWKYFLLKSVARKKAGMDSRRGELVISKVYSFLFSLFVSDKVWYYFTEPLYLLHLLN